ncbi:hypothetical protein [Antrihabitans cavernicola]|uniref:Uncharacterized protein n=1 Tax=Antrihabitans cavernicola TaxID=2495913 RepID=A0A5A7SGG5_9NOCA|nr:hypothetical protein [Spelaeibacter cavernicola]KAA0024916.1 hypothetical protein FOY51_03050 [Spelaeibacter cavernicola]
MNTIASAIAVALTVCAGALVAGCAASPARAPTCSEYESTNVVQRDSKIYDLINGHGIDPNASAYFDSSDGLYGSNFEAVLNKIDEYCGVINGVQQVTDNQSRSIEGALDWSAFKK